MIHPGMYRINETGYMILRSTSPCEVTDQISLYDRALESRRGIFGGYANRRNVAVCACNCVCVCVCVCICT